MAWVPASTLGKPPSNLIINFVICRRPLVNELATYWNTRPDGSAPSQDQLQFGRNQAEIIVYFGRKPYHSGPGSPNSSRVNYGVFLVQLQTPVEPVNYYHLLQSNNAHFGNSALIHILGLGFEGSASVLAQVT
ncbi:hypothetical protein B0H17DRAFT_1176591 [Mycena rosella]|uniref:Uncharacterized protein n=1 Tax=Mycena rosella TaxID=1033263 RepID=A0AAD7GLY0_MYCRO|nr:hypothetical protein B0H17DRAFT_1176591 [Mycena rosella]